jgi:hypothetical protein
LAYAVDLSADTRRAIGATITPLLPTVFGHTDSPGVEIGESFALWYFKGAVAHVDESFAAHVEPSCQLYHQLFVNGEPSAFAHSRLDWNGAWSITRIGRSGLPSRIDQAVSELDTLAPESIEVRLLKTRIYRVTALWLSSAENDRLYVVSAPPYFKHLPLRRLITPEQFVEGLAKEERFLKRRNRVAEKTSASAVASLDIRERGRQVLQGILTVNQGVSRVNGMPLAVCGSASPFADATNFLAGKGLGSSSSVIVSGSSGVIGNTQVFCISDAQAAGLVAAVASAATVKKAATPGVKAKATKASAQKKASAKSKTKSAAKKKASARRKTNRRRR